MRSSLPRVLLVSLVALLLDKFVNAENWNLGESPLPVFTKVETKHDEDTNTTSITVTYDANEEPHFQWFVDDVPFLGGTGDFLLSNNYSSRTLSRTSVSVPDSLGTRYAVCLQTSKARTCLHLRPLDFSIFNEIGESVDFPWPLLVPAPTVRYNTGSKTMIFAPELNAFSYAYSGRFIFLETREHDQSLRLAETVSRGMQGGQAGDIVTMAPVTSGSPGWMMEVATDREGYEGVLMFQTTFTPPNWVMLTELVEKCVTTRPINIYNRHHPAPFPTNFMEMTTRIGRDVSATCQARDDLSCLISCPFVLNGDVSKTQSRLMTVHKGMVDFTSGQVWTLGDYVAEARYVLEGPKDTSDDFQCWVTVDGNTIASHVVVNWV